MNNGMNPNPVQDVNMQQGGQPVELSPTPDNMVNMEQVMGANSSALADVADPAGDQKLKKAAIYIGVIGLLLVVMGVVYSVLGIGAGEETTQSTNKTPTEEVVNDTNTRNTTDATNAANNTENTANNGVENRVAYNSPRLTCKLSSKSDANGVSQILTYAFYDNNGKLTSYDKTYEVIPVTGHSNGIISVNKEVSKYDSLKSKIDSIAGYVMSVSSINNGKTETLTVKVSVDFNTYKNDLPKELKKNKITNVEYNSNSNINTIKKELTKSGYSC